MFTIKATNANGHRVTSCTTYEYNKGYQGHDHDGAVIARTGTDSEIIPIMGTVYVMNDAGRTIDTFHASPIVRGPETPA